MKHFSPSARLALAASVLLGLAGCAFMQRDTTVAKQVDAGRIRLPDDIHSNHPAWPQARWWERYGDAQLNDLITAALANSPAIAVAQARVQTARAQAQAIDASTGPWVGLTASIDREHVSENGFLGPFATRNPLLGTTGPWYTGATAGLAGQYSIDVWGKDRARVDAAIGVKRAREAEEAQIRLLLSVQIAHAYYDWQTTRAVETLLKRARDIEGHAFDAHRARAERGLEPITASQISLAHQLDLEQKIDAAQMRERSLREVIRALTGAGPDGLPAIKPAPLPSAEVELPSQLGYELLVRRPDLQAMHWYVEASMDQTEAAKAAFYPSFDIKAFVGMDSLHLDDLLKKASRQYNFIPGVSLPIFDNGRLNANLAMARSQRNLLIAEYNESIVNAVREVAQTSIELDGVHHQVETQRDQTRSVNVAFDSAEAHFGRGLIDKVSSDEAELPLLLEKGKLVDLQGRQIHAQLSLIAALGGGYEAQPVND